MGKLLRESESLWSSADTRVMVGPQGEHQDQLSLNQKLPSKQQALLKMKMEE